MSASPLPEFPNLSLPAPPGTVLKAIRGFMEAARHHKVSTLLHADEVRKLNDFCKFVDDKHVWPLAATVIFELDDYTEDGAKDETESWTEAVRYIVRKLPNKKRRSYSYRNLPNANDAEDKLMIEKFHRTLEFAQEFCKLAPENSANSRNEGRLQKALEHASILPAPPPPHPSRPEDA